MNILIVHHVEKTFDNVNYAFTRWLLNAVAHFNENSYDCIIYNRSAIDDHELDNKLEDILRSLSPRFYVEYISCGYEIDDDDFEEGEYIKLNDCNSANAWPIPEWANIITKDDNVNICGMFGKECVEELRCFLDEFGISFNEVDELIIDS